MNSKLFLFLLLFAILISSCKKGFDTGWDTDLVAPILYGTLAIDDLIPDSIKVINADNSIDLVYKNTIYDLNIAEDLLQIPDTTVEVTITLDSLKIEDRSFSENISLGEIANALIADGNFLGTLIIFSNGSSIPIDPLTDLTSGEEIIDATTFFESAIIKTGFMDLSIQNALPIDLVDAIFQFKNSTDGAIIVLDTFELIPAGGFVSNTYDLADKTVSGLLVAEILNFESPGSDVPVLIDTSDALYLTMSVRDLNLYGATAIFPAQNLVNRQSDVEYDMGDGGPQLTEMKLKTGKVIINVVNTMQDSINIIYNLPYATDEAGNGVYFEAVCPPAPEGGSIAVENTFILDNFTIDLRGIDGNKSNTFYQEFSASIDSSGIVRTLSLDDSIQVVYGLIDIVPLELKGYIGQFEENVVETTKIGFNLFEFIDEGEIKFDDVTVTLTVNNEVGVDGNFVVHELSAKNTITNTSLLLNAPTVVNTPIAISRALNNPLIPGITVIELNNTNSNIKDLLEIFPDQLTYNVDLNVNPNGNVYGFQDFIVANTNTTLTMDLSIPLNLIATNVTLRDTFDMDITTETEFTEDVISLDLTLFAENGFPLNASIVIYFMDEFGFRTDSVDFSGSAIEAGILNAACRVSEPTMSELKIAFTGDRIANVLLAKQAEVIARFNTQSNATCGETIKIYDDYMLNLNLTARLNYQFTTK